jgi:nucleoside-diphosphate-sugar epimerase
VTVLVTGSSGHLGEALMRTLQAQRRETIGIDIQPGAFTHHVARSPTAPSCAVA